MGITDDRDARTLTRADAGSTEAQALRTVPFPTYAIGLLQSESEMLQAPGYEVLTALESDPRWEVELYTERTVKALVESAERFDCIVVGYNAAHHSAAARRSRSAVMGRSAAARRVGARRCHSWPAPRRSRSSSTSRAIPCSPMSCAGATPCHRRRLLAKEVERHESDARRGGRALAVAGEAMTLAVAALFAITVAPRLGSTWGVPSTFVLWAVLALALLALLGHYGLGVQGAARIAPWLAGGWDAVRRDLAQR